MALAVDILNDKALPFYEQHDLPVLRILTDWGTEHCGRADRHDYQLSLAINDIEQLQNDLDLWIDSDNNERPNMALGGVTPMQKLAITNMAA